METHQHLEALYPADSRFAEIEQLLALIKDGKSAQLIGMPGVGRGNLCKFLVYNHNIRVKHLGDAQTQFHFVFINFAEVKNRPLGDVFKFIFLELVSSLHERHVEDLFEKTDALFKKSLSYKDDLVLFQGLKDAIDFLVHEKNLHIIFLFERLEQYIPILTDDFFVHLRSLRERAKYKFSVVFSVTRPLEDSIEPKVLADFYEFFAGHTVYLSLTDSHGIKFRINYLQQLAGKKIPQKQLDDLLSITGGHGKLMRLGAEALLVTEKMPENQEALEAFLLSQKTIQGALFELKSFLTPSELHVLSQIANGQNPTEQSVFLQNIGLLTSANVFTIPLFAKNLAAQHSDKNTAHITYDSTTDTIRRDDMVISENLTAAEFRLLKYLLEHQEAILDRETIISSVWKDTATTAGVTDQALDQLIFRLRKKIEEDPNNPKYIQTVKGRGIKFVSA